KGPVGIGRERETLFNDRRLRAAPRQEASDRQLAAVDVVPHDRIADAVGLLDHCSIRYREPLAGDPYTVGILGHVPLDLFGPEAVREGTGPSPFAVGKAVPPPSEF